MKRRLVTRAFELTYAAGGHALARALLDGSQRLTILTFHRVTAGDATGRAGLPPLRVNAESFEALMRFARERYSPVPLCRAAQGKLPPRALAVTFDDAYREVHEVARPILERLDMPATIFVPPSAIDACEVFWWDVLYEALAGIGRLDPEALAHEAQGIGQEAAAWVRWAGDIARQDGAARVRASLALVNALQEGSPQTQREVTQRVARAAGVPGPQASMWPRAMGWDELRRCAAGVFEIGSHTVNHGFLTALPEGTARDEVVRSKRIIEERLGVATPAFSYPGGRLNDRVVDLVREAGHRCAVTATPGWNRPDANPFLLRRLNVWNDTVSGSDGRFSPGVAAWALLLPRGEPENAGRRP